MKITLIKFILILSIPSICSYTTPFPSNALKKCYIYTDDREVETLTYSEFRDSRNKSVRIYDNVEQPVSLSSFFITRNKQRISEHDDCINDNWRNDCEDLNNGCQSGVYRRCTVVDRTPVLIYLDISNGTLQILQPNTFVTVSECLQNLILKNNLIRKISQNAFSSLNDLQHLDLANNKLTKWDYYFVHEDIRLKYLNISYNQIKNIDENALQEIETLDISHNNLLKINLNSFGIEYLNVAHNKLVTFKLSNANQLQKLDISHNNLKSLKNCNLEANQLVSLNASYNRLIDFDISTLLELRYLSLANNNIEFFNSSMLTSINELDLSNNKIMLFSNMFEFSSNLNELFLNNNKINDVPVNTFYGLEALKSLSLANNNLNTFEFGSFSGLINLQTLDLSYNKLNDFESDKFLDLNNLQTLLLDGNKCNNLNLTDLNVKLKNLRTIGLMSMFWTCENLVKITVELRKMNINLKHSSIPNQVNYNIDGINCIPEGYNSSNYLKKLLLQSTTVMSNDSFMFTEENVNQNYRDSIDFNDDSDFSLLISENNTSMYQFQNDNDIEIRNTSMFPLYSTFLQKIEKIIKNESNDIKKTLKNLENTTALLLHKFDRMAEYNTDNMKHDIKSEIIESIPTTTDDYVEPYGDVNESDEYENF